MAPSAIDIWRSEAKGHVPRRPSSRVTGHVEPTLPWLAAAVFLGLLNLVLVLGGAEPTSLEQALLHVGLAATLSTAGLVSARSTRELIASTLEEQARPAAEELTGVGSHVDAAAYVDGMIGWTGAVLELLDHGLETTPEADPHHAELATAASDTHDLHDLLSSHAGRAVDIHDLATLRAICTLWDTTQAHAERLAAESDPRWHRRWRARAVVEARLRHGAPSDRPLALPYRP